MSREQNGDSRSQAERLKHLNPDQQPTVEKLEKKKRSGAVSSETAERFAAFRPIPTLEDLEMDGGSSGTTRNHRGGRNWDFSFWDPNKDID